MVNFTLTPAVTVGSLSSQVTVSSLEITAVSWSSTPELAPLGAGDLEITLTDPVSRFQETIGYQDASVNAFVAAGVNPSAGESLGDLVAAAIFAKLIADGKLPPGTVSNS